MAAISFDNSYARLPDRFFANVHPASVPDAKLVRLNRALVENLGLDADWLESPDGLAMLSGNRLPAGAEPIAQAYAGHQFGGWVPQLGDGRAILLGEVVSSKTGDRRDLQLKGSGRTPFSRGGDGKAAIGPVLREYILSEAMAALQVPTTRALAAVTTGELVQREAPLPGAILTRVVSSHIRVGTFQYFYARNDKDGLRELADHAIGRHYPEARSSERPYKAFLESVVSAQAKLVAQWMNLGFIHGVMNTDNMTISGETIDYGPCAFIDDFHPEKVFSSIDRNGRYAWNNQPVAAHWDLMRLAEALSPLLSASPDEAKELAEEAVGTFAPEFSGQHIQGFRAKFGLRISATESPDDDAFISETLGLLADEKVDFTLFFRHLTKVAAGEPSHELARLFTNPDACEAWLAKWRRRLALDGESISESARIMAEVNPILIPRNHRVEEAIEHACQHEFAVFDRLVRALEMPFSERSQFADLETPPAPSQVVCQTFCGT